MADGAGLGLAPPRFDHGAADLAAARLVELAALIDDVVHRRRIRVVRLAGWECARREEFDLAFARHQQDAAEVAELCRATAARIRRRSAAAAAAAAEQARRELGPSPRRVAQAAARGRRQAPTAW